MNVPARAAAFHLMRRPKMGCVRIATGLWLTAGLLVRPDAAGAETDFAALAGPARATSSANERDAAWRDIGVRIETRDLVFEARMPVCQAVAQMPTGRVVDSTASCSIIGDGLASFASSSRRASLVWKTVHETERLPEVDVMLRHWSAGIAVPGTGDRGTTVALSVSKAFGAIDATIAYETPSVAASQAGRWRTRSVSVGWRPAPGMSVELAGDDATELATGERDRSWTMRLARRFGAEGSRTVLWARRSLDGSQGPVRVGVTAQFRF